MKKYYTFRKSIILFQKKRDKLKVISYIYHFLVKVTLAFHPLDWLYPPPKLREEFFDAGEETHLSESLT